VDTTGDVVPAWPGHQALHGPGALERTLGGHTP